MKLMIVKKNRRRFLQCTISIVCVGLMMSCQNRSNQKQNNDTDPLDCKDLSSTPPEELKKRENLGYTETSPMPDKNCKSCNLFIPVSETKPCAGCLLFKGPVEENAYCTYWAPII